jgi:Glycosyl transferases group 1
VMTIDVNTTTPASGFVNPEVDLERSLPNKRLLILNNPGRMSRYWLDGLIKAAETLGVDHRVCELGEIWAKRETHGDSIAQAMVDAVRRERIGAVLSYTMNGVADFGCQRRPDGSAQGLFDAMGVKHLMLWSDHPQWATEKSALRPDVQPLLRSPNNYHFMKSDAAAREIERVLGWPNCHGLAVGEDPQMVCPQPHIKPEFDVVAIVGTSPPLDPSLAPFVDQKNPDVEAIRGIVAGMVREALSGLWDREAPDALRPALRRMGEEWVERRRRDPLTASFRHVDSLSADHTDAMGWLLGQPRTYFDAVECLWMFGEWQRPFYLTYLAKHFRVAVFGSDWSAMGCGGGPWVDHHRQAECYARGRVAVNISQRGDEEGVAHKPFQMAASGVPFVHNEANGLSDCFAIGSEFEHFSTPAQAREVIAELIDDPDRRARMAAAARVRFEREHTWGHRLERMLVMAGLSSGVPQV